jgi:hypothetical protein
MNEVFEKLLKLTGTDQRMTSAYNPRSNGLVERVNQTIMMSLRKSVRLTMQIGIFTYRSSSTAITRGNTQ